MRSLILLAALASALASPVTVRADDTAHASERPLRLLRVFTPRPTDVYHLHRLGLDLISRESAHRTQVAATDQEIAALERQGYKFEVLELDLEAYYRQQLGDDIDRYHTFDQVTAELDRMRSERPDLVSRRQAIGTTWEGRTIWAVKISDHPELDEDEPEVLFDALHHAREPVGMETLLEAMWKLVRAYDTDPAMTYLVDERELWFVPVVNPDGYEWGGIGGLWRKNRRPNADGSFGVDLNRNYGFRWGYDNLGSSPVPQSQTYRGPEPFSEPETRAMRDFMLERPFVTGMTIHTFSDVHLLPYGWAEVRPADWQDFCEIGYDLQRWTHYPFGQPWELLYFSNGRTQDWAYHEAGMMIIEPEIGRPEDGFWPSAERVDELIAKNLPSIFHLARIAGVHIEPVSTRTLDDTNMNGHAEPGETVRLEVSLRNKGYADTGALVATLTAPSTALVVHSPPQRIGALPARTTTTSGVLVFDVSVSPDAPTGVPLRLELDLVDQDGYVGQSELNVTAGAPRLVFRDDGSNGTSHWLAEGDWGVVDSREGGRVFTDSPRHPYAPNTDASLILRRGLDLSAFSAARLSFRESYATEPWSDRGIIEASTNDVDWVVVASNAGGSQPELRDRVIDLGDLAGEPHVRLRFRMISNNMNQKDGWTIDDIEVYGFETAAAGDVASAAPVTAWVSRAARSDDALAELTLALGTEQRVALGLLDASGRLVTTLADGAFAAGEHVLAWDGRDRSGQRVASGVYFYELVTPQHRETLRVVVDIE